MITPRQEMILELTENLYKTAVKTLEEFEENRKIKAHESVELIMNSFYSVIFNLIDDIFNESKFSTEKAKENAIKQLIELSFHHMCENHKIIQVTQN